MKYGYPKSILLLAAFFLTATTSFAQDTAPDSTGLLGDDFSLEGALQLFKKSDNLETFERELNKEDNYVNNLDLNEDGDIDYIRVIDQMDGDAHAIVLQVPISKSESQDVAVIEIEKTDASNAVLQIVGDEDLYGPNHFVEPVDEAATGGSGGPEPMYETERLVVNVWLWPSVRYIYTPGYRLYVSPWRWSYYPVWWSPWRPHPWRWYHTRRVHYRVGFGITTTHRVVRAHRVYTPVRRSSVTVKTRSVKRVKVTKTSKGRKVTASRTSVSTGKKGVSKTTSTTRVSKDGKTVKAGQKKSSAKVSKKKDGSVKATKKTSTKKAKKKKGKGAKKAKTKKKTTVRKKKGKGA